MKVLMFGWEFPPHISGGLGTACFGLTKALSNLGVDITFVVPKLTSQKAETPIRLLGADSIIPMTKEEFIKQTAHLEKYVEIGTSLTPYMNADDFEKAKRRKPEGVSIDFSDNYSGGLLEEVVRFSLVGQKLGQSENFELIHCHDWMTFLAGFEAKKISGKPLIVHVHSTEFDRSGNYPNQDIFNMEKFGMEQANLVVTVSRRMKEIIIEKYQINPAKIAVVYNAVEKDDMDSISKIRECKKKQNEKVVLFLGRITMQKGPEYFIQAAQQVLQKMPNVRFVMAGAGDLAKKMIEKIASLDIIDRFHFTGFLGPNERERLFSMSDLYIMPSVSEPFGITPLEAMKHNIPVIVSKQSGIAEILDDAIKIDFWDIDLLSNTIVDLLNSPQKSQGVIDNNRRTLEQIDWKYVAMHLREIYQEYL